MGILKDHFLTTLILLGLFIRLLLCLLPGFKIDVNDWFAWAIRLNHFNFSQFYSKDVFTDYTPGYLYVLSLLGFLKDSLNLQNNFFYFLLKIPAIISEITIGILVYKEVKQYNLHNLALFALSFILFNPALIFNSSVWGQIDSILAVLLLITILALKKNHLILSSIFFGLALLVKPQAIALIPLLVVLLIVNRFNLSSILKISIPGILIIYILAFPFFPNQTLTNLAQHIMNTASEYPYTSVNAYNLWGGSWILDT